MADGSTAEEGAARSAGQQQQQEGGGVQAGSSSTREQPQRQAKAPPGNGSNSQAQQRNAGGAAAAVSSKASSSSSSSAPARQNSESGSSSGSSTALESIDAVCNAIVTIANIGGDAAMQYNVVRDNLLPALNFLEQKGTSGGVPGSMILQSPLNGNRDPLVYLMQQPQLTGNGLGYLTILLARCCAENPNPHHLVPLILQYIQVADARQLQLVPYKAYCLALWLAHFFGPDGAAGCIEPVYNLLRKLQGDRCRHVLTAIHPILLLASLRANNYHVAMHMLQNYPVMEVDTKLFSVAYHDNLKYHLYAGTVAAIVGNYAMAIELLEAAVSAPAHANTGSLIQIDAYKRLVLVQLIQNGKTTSPPAYTSNHVTQTFRQLCAVYVDFARDYESLSRSKSYAYLADSKRSIFEQDGNLGLVQRALAALPSRAILDLQNVYRTIELGDVVRLVFPEESRSDSGTSKKDSPADPPRFNSPEQAKSFIESEVQRLVVQRKLSAQMVPSPSDPSKRYLEFLPTTSNSQESAAALQRALMSIGDSRWTVSNLDARISGSREFLKKAYEAVPKGGVGAGAAPGHHAGGMDYIEDFMGEEDLMDAKIPGGFED